MGLAVALGCPELSTMERPDRAVEAEMTVVLSRGCGEDGTVGPRATGRCWSCARCPRELETNGNGKDLHLLRQIYIHRFTVLVCCTSEYAPGTTRARTQLALLTASNSASAFRCHRQHGLTGIVKAFLMPRAQGRIQVLDQRLQIVKRLFFMAIPQQVASMGSCSLGSCDDIGKTQLGQAGEYFLTFQNVPPFDLRKG
jgi:hypothetical protein